MAARPEIDGIESAAVVLPAGDLDETIAFFTGRLGFRLDAIFPADDPRTALLWGHGLAIRLERGTTAAPGMLRLGLRGSAATPDAPSVLTAPNWTVIELAGAGPGDVLPPLRQTLVVHKVGPEERWGVGRAGMHYRDLVPDRQGGRFIVSHIRIPAGGPVPDYVHFHEVRFQMIYCRAGWVRVVYEDQGEPFVMYPGDCVLQPPRIRHRVLESSDGLEVIEVGCPAEHPTRVDHDMTLPNGTGDAGRRWSGQRFVRHVAADAPWTAAGATGLEARDLGIGAATDGLAGARVLRPSGPLAPARTTHDAEFRFAFVLVGSVILDVEGRAADRLGPGDAFTLPAGLPYRLAEPSADFELLEISLPAA